MPGTMDVDLNVDDKNPWGGSLTLNNDYSADTKRLRAIASLSNSICGRRAQRFVDLLHRAGEDR